MEGPKPTDEEQEKIADEVGEALEENFKECEKAKKAATDKAKKANGESTDKTDGNCVSIKEDKENGDPNLKSDYFVPLYLAAPDLNFFTLLLLDVDTWV